MPNSIIYEILDKVKNDQKTNKLRMINNLVHVAVIVYRGKIIAEAANRIGYRSICNKTYHNTFVRDKKNIHAEENVVKVLGNYNRLKDADMYVMRLGRGDKYGEFINSKPCEKCACFLNKCMQKYGLKNVYYTS
jgi:hypothetical protein